MARGYMDPIFSFQMNVIFLANFDPFEGGQWGGEGGSKVCQVAQI